MPCLRSNPKLTTSNSNTNCDPGQGRANDTLYVIGSYYDLAGSEEMWDNYPQSFSCRQYNC